ncbi:IS66 family insertion sequence element accessory protein TnpB [Bradyrhizobium iriomotense]|nr:IS66 family insertion sequence element accessory protein TnpB [Bradyrhizobium iriomotense]
MSDSKDTATPERLRGSPRRSYRTWWLEAKERIEGNVLARANASVIARSHGLDPSHLFAWRRKALASDSSRRFLQREAKRLAQFDAVTGDMVEILIGDVVVPVGSSDVEPERLAAVIRAVRRLIPAGAQIYVASAPVDFRKRATGLMALVRDGEPDPFSGALSVFSSKRADRIKAVWWDGNWVCVLAEDCADPGAAKPGAVARADRRAGLDEGASVAVKRPEPAG